jgi:hypothetical protein
LSRALRKFREEGTWRSAGFIAEKLGVGESTVRKWEMPPDDYSIRFEVLQKYQDHYGVPVGIIVSIAGILAAARDNRDDHLQVWAAMLRVLYERVATPEQRKETVARVLKNKSPEQTNYADWDNLLGILIMGVWGAVPHQLLETYQNRRRLQLTAERARRRKGVKAVVRRLPSGKSRSRVRA